MESDITDGTSRSESGSVYNTSSAKSDTDDQEQDNGNEDSGSNFEADAVHLSDVWSAEESQGDDYIQEVQDVMQQFTADHEEPAAEDSEDGELFHGNQQPADFYRQRIRDLDVNHFKRRHYSQGTLNLMKTCENYWTS